MGGNKDGLLKAATSVLGLVWQKTFDVAEPEYNLCDLSQSSELIDGCIETLERWCEHFQSVLNVFSVFSDNTLDLMPEVPLRGSMECSPTSEEI